MFKEPNIIFIMADQLAAGSIGCYGSKVNSTPLIDRLAEKGMRFDRCYASATVCAPNRASILTGRSPVIHGVVANNLELTADNPTYPQVLQSSGYRTGGFGKFHHTCMSLPHPENFKRLGFDETMISEDPKWGGYLDWIKTDHPEHYRAALSMCWDLPFVDQKLRDENADAIAEYLKEKKEQSDWRLMYGSPLPKELHQTTFITDRAMDFISRHTDNSPDKPFFCFVSYVDPHDPYDPPAPYDTMFSPDEMQEPLPSTWIQHGNEILRESRKFCNYESIADNPQAVKKLRALYHGSIRFIDDQIERIVRLAAQRNLAENTIIVFTTDHGDMIGDHGLITKGVKFFDKGIRCPLIVCGKNVKTGISGRLVCSLDLFPSFCDFAEVPATNRPPLEGKSFAQECCGNENDDCWPEVTVESPYQEGESAVRGIITDDNWRFTAFELPETGEMFDLNTDPDEQNNLFYNPQFKDKKIKLFERLTHAFMRSHKIHQYRNLPKKDGRRHRLGGGWELRDDIFNFT
jgi:arylsulfatase A-like enzyme